MEYCQLGDTDIELSRVGLGTAAFSGYDYGPLDPEDAIATVHRALDVGITLFDTADIYGFGRAETLLGQALGRARSDAVVATKVGLAWDEQGRTSRNLTPAHLRAALEGSLSRLGLETIPLYQLHWLDGSVPLEAVVEELLSFQAEGKILHVGVCNVSEEDLHRVAGALPLQSLQLPFSLLERQCAKKLADGVGRGLTTMAYNVLGQGLLAGTRSAESNYDSTDLRRRSALFSGELYARGLALAQELRQVAAREGHKPSATAVRWALDQSEISVVLTGAKSAQQVEENADVDWTLDPRVVEEMEAWLRSPADPPA